MQPQFQIGDRVMITRGYQHPGHVFVVEGVLSAAWLADQAYADKDQDQYFLRRENGKKKAIAWGRNVVGAPA